MKGGRLLSGSSWWLLYSPAPSTSKNLQLSISWLLWRWRWSRHEMNSVGSISPTLDFFFGKKNLKKKTRNHEDIFERIRKQYSQMVCFRYLGYWQIAVQLTLLNGYGNFIRQFYCGRLPLKNVPEARATKTYNEKRVSLQLWEENFS